MAIRAGQVSKGGFTEFVSKFFIGLGAGVVTDLVIEVLRVPLLNDVGTFGNANMSNFEYFSYAIVVGGSSASLVDMMTGRSILGFTKEFLPLLLGYGMGILQYETWIADKLGIRGFNPYETIYGAIPQLG